MAQDTLIKISDILCGNLQNLDFIKASREITKQFVDEDWDMFIDATKNSMYRRHIGSVLLMFAPGNIILDYFTKNKVIIEEFNYISSEILQYILANSINWIKRNKDLFTTLLFTWSFKLNNHCLESDEECRMLLQNAGKFDDLLDKKISYFDFKSSKIIYNLFSKSALINYIRNNPSSSGGYTKYINLFLETGEYRLPIELLPFGVVMGFGVPYISQYLAKNRVSFETVKKYNYSLEVGSYLAEVYASEILSNNDMEFLMRFYDRTKHLELLGKMIKQDPNNQLLLYSYILDSINKANDCNQNYMDYSGLSF